MKKSKIHLKKDTPKRWRVRFNDEYIYYISPTIEFIAVRGWTALNNNYWHESQFNTGNYFKSQETAEKVAESLKLYFEWLHFVDSDPDVIESVWMRIESVAEQARKAVLEDDRSM